MKNHPFCLLCWRETVFNERSQILGTQLCTLCWSTDILPRLLSWKDAR